MDETSMTYLVTTTLFITCSPTLLLELQLWYEPLLSLSIPTYMCVKLIMSHIFFWTSRSQRCRWFTLELNGSHFTVNSSRLLFSCSLVYLPNQLFPPSLYLQRKSVMASRWCHHHISMWGMCSESSFFLAKKLKFLDSYDLLQFLYLAFATFKQDFFLALFHEDLWSTRVITAQLNLILFSCVLLVFMFTVFYNLWGLH